MAKVKVNLANIKKIQAEQIAALGGSEAAVRFSGKFNFLEKFRSGTSSFYLTEIDDASGLTEKDVVVFVCQEEADFLVASKGVSDYYVSHPFVEGTKTLDMTRNILRLDNEVTNERSAAGLRVSDLNSRGMIKAKLLTNPDSRFGIAMRAKALLNAPAEVKPVTLAERAIAAGKVEKANVI